MKETLIKSEKDLPNIAKDILTVFPQERRFGFLGEMGAGKTTLIKALCKELAVIDSTSSPTFAIINEYATKNQQIIYHFDFYRIEDMNEVYQIGVEDYLDSGNYCFMEWPEKVEAMLVKIPYTEISIKINKKNQRIIRY